MSHAEGPHEDADDIGMSINQYEATIATLTAERDRMAAVVEAARDYRNKAKPDDVKSYEYVVWQLDSNDLRTALAALDEGSHQK